GRVWHTMFSRDWSSDVCSSDLSGDGDEPPPRGHPVLEPFFGATAPDRGPHPESAGRPLGEYCGSVVHAVTSSLHPAQAAAPPLHAPAHHRHHEENGQRVQGGDGRGIARAEGGEGLVIDL